LGAAGWSLEQPNATSRAMRGMFRRIGRRREKWVEVIAAKGPFMVVIL
jgi:hypothetical protein